MENTFGDKKHEKIKLCETDNMEILVQWIQALNKSNIPYETRLKKERSLIIIFFS